MTPEEFYAKIGGSYEGALRRFRSDEKIKKFIKFFMADESYQSLCAAYDAKDWDAVFKTSHTMKGVVANLEFTNLFNAASDVCENTRHGAPNADIDAQMERVHAEYKTVVDAIPEVD